MLLLTDRLSHALALKQAVDTVEACTILEVGAGDGSVQAGHHAIILCDVALDHAAALATTRALLAQHRTAATIPLLHLARGRGDTAMTEAQAIGATAVLPHDASDTQILFTIRRLTETGRVVGRTRIGRPADLAVVPEVRQAGTAFSELFDAAGRGRTITTAALTQGGNAVIAAVGGGRISAWLDLVRHHDDVTYQHCLLVAGLATAFSIRLGLSLKGQRLIAQSALVHDIGKAGIPQVILQKPSSLTPAEMAIVRTHPGVGHDMLARQGGFDPQMLDIVRHHHEYLDGSGYPDGLEGEAVSPLVRLMTICDIYAALIERRPYKPPATPAAAFAILLGMEGKLDAGLLHAFKDVVGEG